MCSRLTFAGARVQTTIQDDELDFSLFICYKNSSRFLAPQPGFGCGVWRFWGFWAHELSLGMNRLSLYFSGMKGEG
jgi:hypothetical protein